MITIFTPTYNRAYILHRCYESLKRQTNKNFKWLIVDDGSKDETKELVIKWIKKNEVDITYIRQENMGKQGAHNTGVLNCHTELFICVDSDDYLADGAIEKMYNAWKQFKEDRKLAGLVMLKADVKGHLVGSNMPEDIRTCSIYNLYEKCHFKGDAALLFRTEILRKFLFPIFAGEKFVGESIVYDLISETYEMGLVNEVVYLCEYLEGGYSLDIIELYKRNPKGYMGYLNQRVALAKNFEEKYRALVQHRAGCWWIGHKGDVGKYKYSWINIISFPQSIIMYYKKIIKNKLIRLRVIKV